MPPNAGDAADMGSIPGSGKSAREENGNPLQYSCLETPRDRVGQDWETFTFTVQGKIIIKILINAEVRSVSCSVVSNSLQLHGLQPTRLLWPWNSPGKNGGAGCHSLLQGIFLTQVLNPGLLCCRQILYQLSHQGSHASVNTCLGKETNSQWCLLSERGWHRVSNEFIIFYCFKNSEAN